MTPSQAGALMRRARKLLRAGHLTAKQFVLFDTLIWSCRSPMADRLSVSFTRMAKLARQARATAICGIAVFERLGLLSRVKRRVRVLWGGSIASRQATNVYILHPSTEASQQPAYQVLKKEKSIEDALDRLGRAMNAKKPPTPGKELAAIGETWGRNRGLATAQDRA
jgi:hypothetical protein